MTKTLIFPFGQPLNPVRQVDRSRKRVFVLGVYASAVHATWTSQFGRVEAFAVASEPYIFWRGDRAGEIISQIQLPTGAGRLEPSQPKFNGPSGITLDDEILTPLGYAREDAWLCDLVPHSCVNSSQALAIYRSYLPAMRDLNLPWPNIPTLPSQLANQERVQQIVQELHESQASKLVLLGDEPIKWFLYNFLKTHHNLDAFQKCNQYGAEIPVAIGSRTVQVIALAHPRQISKLGKSNTKWFEAHSNWKCTL